MDRRPGQTHRTMTAESLIEQLAEDAVIIKSLEVEEGFLDGLSVEFVPGLNVVIGPRGVGKTSLIELLRFAFGVTGYTERSNIAALAHARSILGGGRVTATVEDRGEQLTFVRAADEDAPRIVGVRDVLKPIVLSQNEVEQIGLEPASRMRLLDGFRQSVPSVTSAEDSALAMVASLTAEIQAVARAARAADEKAISMSEVDAALEQARQIETQLSASVAASEPDRKRLDQLSQDGAVLEVRRDALEKAREVATTWMTSIRELRSRVPDIQFPSAAGDRAAIERVEVALSNATQKLDEVTDGLHGPVDELEQAAAAAQRSLVQVQDEARDLRRKVDALTEGAGQASQQVANLQVRVAQRDALREEAAQLRNKVMDLRDQRSKRLQALETARDSRFAERSSVASRINNSLSPVVHVRVDRDAGLNPYVEAITELLQGSGLHYNTLAQQLAERVSPREFVEAVELGDVPQLVALAGLSEDRAARVVVSADKPALERVLTARIDDHVEITLLDESVPKATQSLSTGQRCTAVLPILLLHDERVLVLDQPEDHLDNAYVVETLVRSLRKRSDSAQTIVATHNPNIPVLGDAAHVVLLGSDGKHGFVRLAAPLTSPDVVSAISQVMEGGAEAFRLRAKFYAQHLG